MYQLHNVIIAFKTHGDFFSQVSNNHRHESQNLNAFYEMTSQNANVIIGTLNTEIKEQTNECIITRFIIEILEKIIFKTISKSYPVTLSTILFRAIG